MKTAKTSGKLLFIKIIFSVADLNLINLKQFSDVLCGPQTGAVNLKN
jgi:hypothetical protein